jgi:hypothetical protein
MRKTVTKKPRVNKRTKVSCKALSVVSMQMKPIGEIYTYHLSSLAKYDFSDGAIYQQIDNKIKTTIKWRS